MMFDRSCSAYCGVCSRSATASKGSGCGFARRFVKPDGVLPAADRKPYGLALPGEGRRVRVAAPDSRVRLGPPRA